MSSSLSNKASSRLTQVADFLTLNKRATTAPFDPNCTIFPSRHELPSIPGAPEGAAWVWGKDDNIGRLNLLTPTRVTKAAKEVKSGEIVNLNLPLDVPKVPAFGRKPFEHEIKALAPGLAYDDLYKMNTQSGTQWDGFRHIAHMPTASFYNGIKGDDIDGEHPNHRCGIHHLSDHGIAGRGILLDYWYFANHVDKTKLYDPYKYNTISYADLHACGLSQGIDIRPASKGGDVQIGDLLFIRTGFVDSYHSKTNEERSAAALRPHALGKDDGQRWTGVKQEDAVLDWLHDSYFSAVAGDAPAFEAWPSHEDYMLHEYILAMWGMPLGEMFDLEKLASTCREKNRWTFFVTSSPANCPGGVGSHGNALAIF